MTSKRAYTATILLFLMIGWVGSVSADHGATATQTTTNTIPTSVVLQTIDVESGVIEWLFIGQVIGILCIVCLLLYLYQQETLRRRLHQATLKALERAQNAQS